MHQNMQSSSAFLFTLSRYPWTCSATLSHCFLFFFLRGASQARQSQIEFDAPRSGLTSALGLPQHYALSLSYKVKFEVTHERKQYCCQTAQSHSRYASLVTTSYPFFSTDSSAEKKMGRVSPKVDGGAGLAALQLGRIFCILHTLLSFGMEQTQAWGVGFHCASSCGLQEGAMRRVASTGMSASGALHVMSFSMTNVNRAGCHVRIARANMCGRYFSSLYLPCYDIYKNRIWS